MSFSDLVSASGTLSSGLSLPGSYQGYYLQTAVLFQEALRDLFIAIAIAGISYDHFRLTDLALRACDAQIGKKT